MNTNKSTPQPPTSRPALHRWESSSGRSQRQPPASPPGPHDGPHDRLGSEHCGHPPHRQLWAHSRGTGISHPLSELGERIPSPEQLLALLPPRQTGPARDPESGGKDGPQISGHPLMEGPPECWVSGNFQGPVLPVQPQMPRAREEDQRQEPQVCSPALCPGHYP